MLAGVLTLRALVWLCWLVRVCACECPFVETSNSFRKEKNHLMCVNSRLGGKGLGVDESRRFKDWRRRAICPP